MAKYKRKILFTLIEILIVVVIVGIILGALSYLSWRYILRLKFDADRQIFLNAYQTMLSKSLGLFGGGKSYTGGITLISGDKNLYLRWLSGANKYIFRVVRMQNSKVSTIMINGNFVDSGDIIFRSYKLGLLFKDNDGNIYTGGNLRVGLISSFLTGIFNVNLDIGKLY